MAAGTGIYNKNELNYMHTNARSMFNNNKRDEINKMLIEDKVDILGITESWSHEGIDDAELNFEGYTLFRRDRGGTDRLSRGGVDRGEEAFCYMLRKN